MSDPKVIPQSQADIARIIEQQSDFIEHFRIREIPICIEGLCEEIE